MVRKPLNHGTCTVCGGELTALEHQVIESLREHELLAANVVAESTEGWTGRSTPIPSSC